MQRLLKFATSSIGLKYIMALTGIGLMGFVIAHMLGNLQIFLGQQALNDYGHKLQSTPALLWPARIGLLTMLIVHIGAAMRLNAMSAGARSVDYVAKTGVQLSYASKSMLQTGAMVAVFIALHLAHFTLHLTNPEFKTMEHNGQHDVYGMVVAGFSSGLWVLAYVFFNIVLGFHLSHGASSVLQTLGLNTDKTRPAVQMIGPGVATLVVVGNLTIPLAVYFGLVTTLGGGA